MQHITIKYQAEDAVFDEPALLININKLYHHDMTPQQLYEATRKHWKVSRERVNGIQIICAVYVGIIREVYIPQSWRESPLKQPGRSYFEGQVAPEELRSKYINKSVARYWPKGNQNPIKYISAI